MPTLDLNVGTAVISNLSKTRATLEALLNSLEHVTLSTPVFAENDIFLARPSRVKLLIFIRSIITAAVNFVIV